MSRLTEYGVTVKKRLIDLNMTQTSLAASVRDKTGLYVDGGYLHKILTGERKAPNVVSAINEILDLDCS